VPNFRDRSVRRIRRAEDDYYNPRAGVTPVAEWAWRRFPPVFEGREAPDLSRRGQTADVSTRAAVNHGRWVAGCPFCDSAQVVSPTDPRYLCAGVDVCANGPVKGAFVTVEFPAEALRDEIEAALMVRPTVNRNWRAPETPADLREENAANGLDDA
jgi:hypothetical protein